MAKYSAVNGVYRKVSKKYDPVNGVYRNVKVAYDPVNGVYREYFSSGVKWIKYNAETYRYYEEDSYWNEEEDFVSDSGYNVSIPSWYTDYTFSSSSGLYGNAGSHKWTNAGHEMPTDAYVYNVYQDDKTVLHIYRLSSDQKCVYEWTQGSIINTGYTVDEEIGAVFAAEGEYPDTENGYTYVTISDGYTIMKDPSTGKYYAYLQEE